MSAGMIAGVGTDIVDLARFGEAVRRQGSRFLEKVFTTGERRYCERSARRLEHYAARFAAKEAVLKALGTGWSGGIRWTDVEVVRREGGRVEVKLSGRASELARGRAMHLSLSHSQGHAVAFAVLEDGGTRGRRRVRRG